MKKAKKSLRRPKKKCRRLVRIKIEIQRNISCSDAADLLHQKIQEFLSEQSE